MLIDPSLNLRPQKDRTIFSIDQMLILERAFQMDKHPSNEIRKSVAFLSELPLERVRIWYQNRRAKEKRDEEDRLALLAEKVTICGSVSFDNLKAQIHHVFLPLCFVNFSSIATRGCHVFFSKYIMFI